MLDYTKSFIETQFPVSKVSKESYKERKANLGQTLTGLGKWWGRKPLVLVRAVILGILLPVSDSPKKDMDIYLKLLTMDDEGLCLRKFKNLTMKDVYSLLTKKEKEEYFDEESTENKPKYKKGITKEERKLVQDVAFNRLSYDDKLKYCNRPEHVENLTENSWIFINEHLETSADSFSELIKELGEKRYGRVPRVGDCFSGGGSIPFEAARLGCDVYASDLNPIATLLTWSALNIGGASDKEVEKLKEFQQAVYNEVDKQIMNWGIEDNEEGHRADSYLYCNETTCPECGYKVPLAPSWVVGRGTKTVAMLKDNEVDGFDIDIIQGASKKEFKEANSKVTIKNNNVYCPHCEKESSIISIRKDRKDEDGNTVYGLRLWENDEFMPRKEDVFQERLYCIRYVKEYIDEKGNEKTERYYIAPTKEDLRREEKVEFLLSERFNKWQRDGYIPSAIIERGYNTDQPIRERGWQYWHHLFNPRQLLTNGLFAEIINNKEVENKNYVIGLLGINKLINWNAKLSRWNSDGANEKGQEVFSNQALNTLYNYLSRTMTSLTTTWFFNINNSPMDNRNQIETIDATEVERVNDIWITDPPYADAVNYHELTEFFLAWDKKLLERIFPDWYTDSKRVLAVKGVGEEFNNSMIEIYKNLVEHMPDNGTQVVMFTHQDVKVWAELAMVFWASGLRVISAWNIATETDASGLKQGNFVKGTVILVLKKQTSDEVVFQDELYEDIKDEVEFQIDSMKDLDDKENPNFNDGDYQLASYASSLKILTSYKNIEGIDINYELSKIRDSREVSPIEDIINKAVKIGQDYLIPKGMDKLVWRDLTTEEKFYIRGMELESNNIYQISTYQELARGFGVSNYKDMFENFKANCVRLKTPTEYGNRGLSNEGFGNSMLRHLLVAISISVKTDTTVEGVNYLRSTFEKNNKYWNKREDMINILSFIERFENIYHMEHWHEDSRYAKLLKGKIHNDIM